MAFENVGKIKQQSRHENNAGHADQEEGRKRKKLEKGLVDWNVCNQDVGGINQDGDYRELGEMGG